MNRTAVRVFFKKSDRAVYISHLDLLRTMQRALKRSGLPVWYSEGFNPRIYLSFPLALSLGVEGECEPVDMYMTSEVAFEETVKRLDGVMPDGLSIVSAAAPVHKACDIGSAGYSAFIAGNAKDIDDMLKGFASQQTIPVLKHSKKKGMVETDIKPYVNITKACEAPGGLNISFVLPAGNELNINAGVFIGAVEDFCGARGITCDISCIKRTNIFCKNGDLFA